MSRSHSKQKHRRVRPPFDLNGNHESSKQDAAVADTVLASVPTNRVNNITKEFLDANIEHLTTTQKERLARQLGYDSFESMIEASTIVTLSDGSAWWLTSDHVGSWTAWNLCDIDALPGVRPAN